MNPRSHIFISYARSDGESFARQIHERLEGEENLACWRDRLELQGGEDFWRQLEGGISTARWALIVLTPGALTSEWTAREWREARKRGVPICPVWPLSANELGERLQHSSLPAGMQRSHVYMPFPDGAQSSERASEEWQNLVATLRRDKEVARVPFMAPPLPPHYVERAAEIAAISELVLEGAITALRGAGGLGKTTLAKAVARSDEIVDTFYDGVLWVTLGTQPKLVETIADLCGALGETNVHFSGLDAAESRLRARLENLRCLVIIDDAWRASDVQPFIGLGPSVVTLVTTRIADVARIADGTGRVKIEQMTEHQAARVLLTAVPLEHRRSIENRCRQLSRRLGCWPLLLRLAAGQLLQQLDYDETPERALQYIEDNLRESGFRAATVDASMDDFQDPRRRDLAFATSIGGSLNLLGETEQLAFTDLGVFPEDVAIPLATAGQLWGLRDAKGMALKLANLSLIDLHLGEQPAIRIHDQILSFAGSRLKQDGRWAEGHRRLVSTWKNLATPSDDYACRWVCHHLKEAVWEDRLVDLLFDYDALVIRVAARSAGIDRVIADYGLIAHRQDGSHVQRALRRAAHILARYPHLLAQQLLARITRDSEPCQKLLANARARAPRHVLLPRTCSLASRDTVVRQVVRHEDSVTRLVLTGDGRVVTGGYDGRVYCTSLDEGEPILVARHQDSVEHLMLIDNDLVVTGGRDGLVYCAPLDGREPVLLAQHDGRVVTMAATSDHRLVTGGEDGRVYCARLDGGEPVLLARHEGAVRHLALTGDGRVVTRGDDTTMYCVGLNGGDAAPFQQGYGVTQLALTDGGRLVAGDRGGGVYCARLDGSEVVFLARHTGPVTQLALTADSRVVTGGADGCVYCAGLDGSRPVLVAQHTGPVTEVTLAADGRVVTGGADGYVYCARLDRSEPGVLARHEAAITHLVLTRDGRVVSASDDGGVHCARLDGTERLSLSQHRGTVWHLMFTGDGRVVTTGADGRVYCARLDVGEPELLADHEKSVSQVALTGDGRVVSGGSDGRVYCSRLDGGEQVLLARHEEKLGVRQIALTGDGRVVSGGDDGRVYCARLDDIEPPRRPAQHQGAVRQLVLTGDGRVVSGADDGRVFCTRLDTGESRFLLQHEGPVHHLALTSDSRLVTCGADGRVYCVDLDRGTPVLIIQLQKAVWALLLTGDGRVVIGGEDGGVCAVRLDKGEPVPLIQHDGAVWKLALADDDTIVSGGSDGCVYRAQLDGGEPVLLGWHQGAVHHVMLTGDGRVVSGGDDGRVYSGWLVGRELRTVAEVEGSLWVLALTHDGRVVMGGWSGVVHSVPLDGGEPEPLVEHEGGVSQLALTRDDRAVTAGEDGRVCCTPLNGGAPAVLVQHDGRVKGLALTDSGLVISTGTDGVLFVTDLADPQSSRIFAADLTLSPIVFDAANSVVVVGDTSGSLHILPLN